MIRFSGSGRIPLPDNFPSHCSDSMTQAPVAVAENNFYPESLYNHFANAVSQISISLSRTCTNNELGNRHIIREYSGKLQERPDNLFI